MEEIRKPGISLTPEPSPCPAGVAVLHDGAMKHPSVCSLIAAALLCGLPPRTVTPIAWIERRLATYHAAFGLDAQPERIAA